MTLVNKKKFYITTTLPYVNAAPHIGFALEIVQADVIARLHKEILGEEVIFNFGTDEHGLKIYRKAVEQGKDPQDYCDEFAAKFDDLKKGLNLSYTNFIRTTDPHHVEAAQEFWKLCDKNGYIEKKNYRSKYCVGCELEKTDSELVDGKCPIHPNLEIETYEEENYFFKFSKFQKPLLELYEKNPEFVVPQTKFKEIKAFVEEGLNDFSISRLKSKMPWGVSVPNDPEHVMYVWFDALVNYISTLGWPENKKNYSDFWPGIQVAGKDNLRQQTAIWQAMLIAADLPNSKQVFIHGFISVAGQKISKSLGNAVNPLELVQKYGTDAVRYYLLAKVNPYDDSDFTIEKFEEAYNADLANGIGNLVARVAKQAETLGLSAQRDAGRENPIISEIKPFLDQFRFDQALLHIWGVIRNLDQYLEKERPWEQTAEDSKIILGRIVRYDEGVDSILDIIEAIKIFLPDTGEKIASHFNGKITAVPPLFPRISK